MLTRFDPELVGWLMEKFSEIGIEVQTGTPVEAIEHAGSGLRVRARAKSREIAIDADLVVHAAGRAPDLDALNLAAAGVAVGLSEAEARNQAPKLRVNSAKVPDWYTARRVREAVYGYKTLVEAESARILGAHLVRPHADEVINVFGIAIRHNLTADDLKTTMFAYPTGASDISYML